MASEKGDPMAPESAALKRGRPKSTVQKRHVSARLPEELVAAFLSHARRRGLTETQALRKAIINWLYGDED